MKTCDGIILLVCALLVLGCVSLLFYGVATGPADDGASRVVTEARLRAILREELAGDRGRYPPPVGRPPAR